MKAEGSERQAAAVEKVRQEATKGGAKDGAKGSSGAVYEALGIMDGVMDGTSSDRIMDGSWTS